MRRGPVSRREVVKGSAALATTTVFASPLRAAAPEPTATTPALIDAAKKEGKVVYYTSVDLPLADFGRLFGPAGVFESFFKGTMANFVDTNQAAWRWKPEAASIGGSGAIPAARSGAGSPWWPSGGRC